MVQWPLSKWKPDLVYELDIKKIAKVKNIKNPELKKAFRANSQPYQKTIDEIQTFSFAIENLTISNLVS